jgi:hypothetical protein
MQFNENLPKMKMNVKNKATEKMRILSAASLASCAEAAQKLADMRAAQKHVRAWNEEVRNAFLDSVLTADETRILLGLSGPNAETDLNLLRERGHLRSVGPPRARIVENDGRSPLRVVEGGPPVAERGPYFRPGDVRALREKLKRPASAAAELVRPRSDIQRFYDRMVRQPRV